MQDITLCGEFLASAFSKLWNAIGGWGIFGVCLIAPAIIKRVGNLFKKIFEF